MGPIVTQEHDGNGYEHTISVAEVVEEGKTCLKGEEEGPPAANGDTKTLEWNIEEFSVKTRRSWKKLRILDRISGRVESGDLVAILGPSGCGKTTFLECLALRNTSFKGAIHWNGKSVNGRYYNELGYVHQMELFFAHLTVREHLRFHAINRNGGSKTIAKCEAMVEAVLGEMGLRRAADTIIGGGFLYYTKGISGGERKRLAIATELLSEPSVLLLDEPTSGLDSMMGELICLHLKGMTRDKHRIIMATIHSPSVRMWSYFNKVMLFTARGGHMAYLGSKGGADAFLADMGHVRHEDGNPAEFYLETVSSMRLDEKQGVLVPSRDYEQIHKAFEERRRLAGYQPISVDNSHRRVRPSFTNRSSFWTQLQQNTTRYLTEVWRDKQLLMVMFFSNQVMGLIFGLLYWRQLDSGRNLTCMLFAILITVTIIANGHVALHFPLPFQVFNREVFVGANTCLPYFLANCVADIPRLTLISLQAIVPYFMVGMHFGAEFFRYWLCVFLVVLGAGSVAYLGTSFSYNPAIGILLSIMITIPMILFSGLLYDTHTVPRYLSWLQEVSVLRWGFAGVLSNFCEDPSRSVYNICSFWVPFVGVDPTGYKPAILRTLVLVICFRAAAFVSMAAKVILQY